MEEREMLKKIAESAQELKAPKALEPDQVKRMLQSERIKNSEKKSGAGKGRHLQKWSRYRTAAAAACLCLCFGAGGIAYQNHMRQENYSQSTEILEGKGKQTAAEAGADEKAANDTMAQNTTNTKTETAEDADTAVEAPVKKLGKMYTLASGYEEVYDVLKKTTERILMKKEAFIKGTFQEGALRNGMYEEDTFMMEESADAAQSGSGIMDIAAAMSDVSQEKDSSSVLASSKESAADVSGDFSETNLQVEGVDESDCVKTDGKFLYVVQDAQIQVVDVREQLPKAAGTIQPDMDEDTDRICEMYVADGMLTVIVQTEQTSLRQGADGEEKEAERLVGEQVQRIATKAVTKAVTYDLTDPEHPVQKDTVTQDGWFRESRKIANRLYLFTEQSLVFTDEMQRKEMLEEDKLDFWLPCVDSRLVPVDSIYLQESGSQGLLMASIDLADHNKVLDTKLLVNQYAKLYVSSSSVYIYYNDYANDAARTRIARFALEADGSIRAKAAKTVKGSIEDTFAIHERGGCLQVLTSVTNAEPWENRVYVLDENMEIVGKLTGLAKGEKIYAARFAGTVGYFVTYRNTDPLFTVDFSNPKEPKVIGELKVTGFSEYLHFWSDDRLLGIGYETDPDSGMTIGIKLSMFDISNPVKVREEAKLVLKDVIQCDGIYDYKAVLVNPKKNVIAFTTEKNEEKFEEHYRVFSFENGAFVNRIEYTLHSGENAYPDSRWRSVYVGDMLYLVNERKVIAFAMAQGWKEVAKLKFD
ncbi:MAG: beta-propeller domain-containing protein [Eubacterium sp.]|nr:beta-propeller domain-containing protein [Eubacterium sp.]